MSALQPIKFQTNLASNLKWASCSENLPMFYHIKNTCREFPSLILAFSASTMAKEIASIFAEGLLSIGINVFLPEEPSPIAALSQAIGVRGMPIALYLDIDPVSNLCIITAINNHGGPIDEKDILDSNPLQVERNAVVGQTELCKSFVSRLLELADPFLEDGIGFSKFITPFPKLNKQIAKQEKLKYLFAIDENGPVAEISNDGQKLKITKNNGEIIPTDLIVLEIGNYLISERMANGSIVGPSDIEELTRTCDFVLAEDDAFEMSYHAGFSDLLLGWWNDGVIAHQGSSCFGDAFLSAIYLIEAWRNKS